jgi:hypothetical protein
MCGEQTPDLLPLPVVPYGISLALSVAYKKMRGAKLVYQQSQAKSEFQACYNTLQNLRETWWTADIIASLARMVVNTFKIPSPGQSTEPLRREGTINARVGQTPLNEHPRPITSPLHVPRNHFGNSPRRRSDTRNLVGIATPQKSITVETPLSDQALGFRDPGYSHGNNCLTTEAPALSNLDNIDHIFGNYLDPNFPLNYEDHFNIEDLEHFEWGDGWN